MQLGRLLGKPVQGVSRGDELERPRLREVLRRRGHRPREVKPHDGVSELPGAPGGTPVDSPANHDTAAHAGADGDHHQVARHQVEVLVVGLGQRGDGRVVVHEHRHAHALREYVAQLHVA